MRPRGWIDWLVLGAVVALCVATAFGAYTLANYSWNAIVDYTSPYVELGLPKAVAGSEISSTTVLVIVDGLNEETSRQLDGLNLLRQYGTDLTLLAPQPSLSYPNWTTLLSGDPPYVSGVTTNWYEGMVPPETLLDTAVRAKAPTVVVGPEEMKALYGTDRATATFLRSYPTTYYASTELVDEAIKLVKEVQPRLALVHLPDVDNAGHRSGSGSAEYLETAHRVDVDLERLVTALQGDGTTFVIVADHGHIPAGGHGGWEASVVEVPGIFFGHGVLLGEGNANQEDVAPTVAVIAGIPVPKHSKGDVLDGVVGEAGSARLRPAWSQRLWFATEYITYVLDPTGQSTDIQFAEYEHGASITRAMDDADSARLAYDRRIRLWQGLAALGIALGVLLVVGLVSWRALVAALSGTLAYYLVYNGLFFVVHGYRWSLSSFNEETMVQSFFNVRMVEALLAGLAAALVAGVVYPYLRAKAQGPWGSYLPRWLTLGPTAVLVILVTLAIQVAWFAWAWGIAPTWNLPDLKWGFKYDLDLIQATALGVAAMLAPLVTYLVGRYHPKTRRVARDESGVRPPQEPIPIPTTEE